ncbi:MAG: hypothetical protein ABIT37_00460 [Luteolibacter sp.]
MKPVTSITLTVAAGFIVGFNLPVFDMNPKKPTTAEAPRTSSRHAAEAARAWQDSKIDAGKRMSAFVEKAAGLSPAEWPAFFKTQQNSPEWSRLSAQLWADNDPEGFWKYLREQKDPLLLDQWGSKLMVTWAAADPDAAMKAVLGVTDKTRGDSMRRDVVDAALAHDLAKGLGLAAVAGDFNSFGWGPEPWMNENPEAAVRGLAALPMISDYRDYLKYALEIWAQANPQAALEWMKNENPRRNEQPNMNDEWMSAGFKAAAKTDPKAALAAALALTLPRERDQALGGVLTSGTVSAADLPALLDACSITAKARFICDAVASLPMESPADLAAATEILKQAPACRETLRATESMARTWSSKDWSGGWNWAASLPDLAMRRKAFEAIAEGMNQNQSDTMIEVISQIPLPQLSNTMFQNVLAKIPANKREEWITKLPSDRAGWARSNLK